MPATLETAQLPCPKCRRPYEWQPEFVGRMAQCLCGHVMRVPAHPGKPKAAPKPPPLPHAAPASVCIPGIALPPLPPMAAVATDKLTGPLPAARPTRCPCEPPPVGDPNELDPELLAELDPGKHYSEEAAAAPSRFKDHDLPFGLLAVGLLLVFGQVAFDSRHNGAAMIAATAIVTIKMVISVALMLIGVLIASRAASIDFGPAGPAILKLCAIYVGPSTLGALVAQLLGGDMAVGLIGSAISVVLYWSLLSYLFRLDGMQTMICALTIWAVNFVAAMCVIGSILASVSTAFM